MAVERQIGPYRVLARLGRGGMSAVYKVALPGGGVAALKRCEPPELLVDIYGFAELARLFTAEAKLMAALAHPAVARAWGFGEDDGRPHYLLEYFCDNLAVMIGEEGDDPAPTRPVPPELAGRWTLGLLAGLAALHRRGIVHRDVKPSNVMLTSDDQVRLIDFGLALSASTPRFPGGASGSVLIGSPLYQAPEQARDPDRVDGRADLYSAAMVLHRLLTGRVVRPGDEVLAAADTDLGRLWRPFFTRGLAREPGTRFAHADDMARELRNILEQWQTSATQFCAWSRGRPAPPVTTVTLETQPRRVPACHAAGIFGLDELLRPRRPVANLFTAGPAPATVVDRATNRVWAAVADLEPMDLATAQQAVAACNQRRLGGIDSWRLPTVLELLSLATAGPRDEAACRRPRWLDAARRLWSCDTSPPRQAWYVDLQLGYTASQATDCCYQVLACSGDVV